MELKKSFSRRKLLAIIYVVFAFCYFVFGLQSARAFSYHTSAELRIPAIGLVSDVTTLALDNHTLNTPDEIVGSFSKTKNNTLLVGHSTTVFKNLSEVKIGDNVFYDNKEYLVISATTYPKEEINMNRLLAYTDSEAIKIMTCSGEIFYNGDASHRLIITAVLVQ